MELFAQHMNTVIPLVRPLGLSRDIQGPYSLGVRGMGMVTPNRPDTLHSEYIVNLA